MSGHQAHGGGHHEESDTKAAFTGLIGGALFIGLILYGIVLLTNKKFEGHEAAPAGEHKAAVTSVIGATVA